MSKTKPTTSRPKTTNELRPPKAAGSKSVSRRLGQVVVSMGCPSGVGPEVTLAACLDRGAPPAIIVGDRGSLVAAARALGIDEARAARIPDYRPGAAARLQLLVPGPALTARERVFGKPSRAGGKAQLDYVESGFRLAKELDVPLVTGPVSKEAIATSGLARARGFRGHTEWLEAMDGAAHSVMCFASSRLVSSLVTTHLPLARVPRAVSIDGVMRATVELWDLLVRLGIERPSVAICSLNPHAGEGELLGREEANAIVPGIVRARAVVGRRARLIGPIGAETAFRKAAGGTYDGVVAMYHDQATIPMKLVDFGGGVNVTQGLSIVRTSVDHGTAYDIAGKGLADPRGMRSALDVANRLGVEPRRAPQPPW